MATLFTVSLMVLIATGLVYLDTFDQPDRPVAAIVISILCVLGIAISLTSRATQYYMESQAQNPPSTPGLVELHNPPPPQ